MPKKRFSDEQIALALRQGEAGTTVGEICRKLGVAEAAFYRWTKVYAGMGVSEIRRLKQLEDENGKLKRLYRLYCEEGLSIRTRSPKRRRACRYRAGRSEAGGINDVWAMDFMSDKLFDGKPFRILTIVDCFTREALATAARTNFRAYQAIDELDRLACIRGKPRSIRVDNGPEFAGRLLDQ